MGVLERGPQTTHAPQRMSEPSSPIGFDPRFHKVGEGLFQSADGRARLRCPGSMRVMLRIVDADRTEMWTGLQVGPTVYLRRSDGEIFRARVRWWPGSERFVWGRFEQLHAPSRADDETACRLQFYPRTNSFRSMDGRLSGLFNPENGRICQDATGATWFEGLVGNGFATLCFADGRSAVLGTGRHEEGDYLMYGVDPYLSRP